MARTSCSEAVALSHAVLARTPARARPAAMAPHISNLQELRVHESVTVIHSPAGRHHAAYGRRVARGLGRVHAVAGLGAARGRLPNYPGGDVLSGSRSGGDGIVGDLSSGAPVRPGTRPEPDDLDQFVRQFCDNPAVRSRP